jgi:hypothetical protein
MWQLPHPHILSMRIRFQSISVPNSQRAQKW